MQISGSISEFFWDCGCKNWSLMITEQQKYHIKLCAMTALPIQSHNFINVRRLIYFSSLTGTQCVKLLKDQSQNSPYFAELELIFFFKSIIFLVHIKFFFPLCLDKTRGRDSGEITH